MEKEEYLRNRGNVLGFADFIKKINENIAFELRKNGATVKFDSTALETIWNVIMTECGGDVEQLKQFLANGEEINIDSDMIIKYIMDLVNDFLNHNVVVIKGEYYVKNYLDFVGKARKLDYIALVSSLLSRLYGDEDMENYVQAVQELIHSETDCLEDEDEEDYEEEYEEE